MPEFRPYTCCFTGHRTIPKGEEEEILAQLDMRICELLTHDVVYFGVGGALGFDTLCAEYLIKKRSEDPRVRIIEVLPFLDYRNRWNSFQQDRAAAIDQQVDKIIYCSKKGSREAYLIRNRHLVDCSSYCISYCTRTTGGTAYTIEYAKAQGLTIWNMSSRSVT